MRPGFMISNKSIKINMPEHMTPTPAYTSISVWLITDAKRRITRKITYNTNEIIKPIARNFRRRSDTGVTKAVTKRLATVAASTPIASKTDSGV